MQCARAMFSSMTCPVLPYCPTLSHKLYDIWAKVLKMKCVFWFSLQLLSEIFLTVRIIRRDITIKVHESSCKVGYPLFLSGFNETSIFSTDFRKNPQISNFVKIRPAGTELFQAVRQTDMRTDRYDEANSLVFKLSPCSKCNLFLFW